MLSPEQIVYLADYDMMQVQQILLMVAVDVASIAALLLCLRSGGGSRSSMRRRKSADMVWIKECHHIMTISTAD